MHDQDKLEENLETLDVEAVELEVVNLEAVDLEAVVLEADEWEEQLELKFN
jgi:hypothetical protein